MMYIDHITGGTGVRLGPRLAAVDEGAAVMLVVADTGSKVRGAETETLYRWPRSPPIPTLTLFLVPPAGAGK